MQYLADSDWTIDYLNGIPRIVQALNGFLPEGMGISIISMAEIYDGIPGNITSEDAEQALSDFLDYVEVVPLDDNICRIFARERRR